MTDRPPAIPGLEDIQRQELARLFERIAVLRLGLSPLLGVLALIVALADEAVWRRAVLAVVALAMFGLSWFELARFRRQGLRDWTLPANLAAMALMQAVVIGVTGALDSPLLPIMIPLAALAVMLSAQGSRLLVPGLQLLVLLAYLVLQLQLEAPLLHLGFLGPPPQGPPLARLLTRACIMAAALGATTVFGGRVRGAFDAMVTDALVSRAAVLDAHAEQARTLRALSAEIAHELKNPLASVKGLSALLARDLVEGRPAERLAVLRGEVDRMQQSLDELLTFTRPLVPLSLTSTALVPLCREVAGLHEGLAQERGVALRVEGGAELALRCDPRKVRQILINLVQNALAVAPRGSVVRLVVRAEAEGLSVEVKDQGPGLDPTLAQRVFEPGVTGRPDGSGLGLTIARAVARQHGGELSLAGGPGGCTARLVLPRDLPQEAP